jgi:cytochrome c oxidase assembly factor CtaG
LLLAAPLLVLSLSAAGSRSSFEKISAFLNKRSWLAWTAGVGVMWCWHIPVVLEASITPMQSFSAMPLLHTGSMLAAGILFSWPLFGPVPEQRIHSLPGVFYLFTACISCSLLGLLITFAPLGTFYAYPAANQPMNGMTGNPWNLTPAADQQTAGLIMWVPCCFIYLTGCVYLLRRWFTAPASITYSTTSHE